MHNSQGSRACGQVCAPAQHPLSLLPIGWHGNHTHHFYAELENFGKGNVYSSSVMLVCVVLGLVITISCVTIILAKKAWRLQPRRRHCLRRYHRGDAEADQGELLSFSGPGPPIQLRLQPRTHQRGGCSVVRGGGWAGKAS